jgi:hypothetical protein
LIVFLTFALIAVPLSFLVQLLQAAFSRPRRNALRKHPFLYSLWFLAAAVVTVFLIRLASQPLPDPLDASPRVDVRNLAADLDSYRREYGRYPLQSEAADHEYSQDYPRLFDVLSASDADTNQNQRNIVFASFPRARFQDGLLVDPWQNPFHVVADWSGDGAVLVGSNVVRAGVAVWSNGKNRINDKGQGDDIRSW